MVRQTPDGIEDIIIIETKLSSGTSYTPRQKEGWKKLANGEDLKLKYRAQGKSASNKNVSLLESDNLTNAKIKTYKVSDQGKASIDISEISVNDYKGYIYKPNKN
ncbi:hypothetical protein N6H18_02180 [Reichenbachiella agarivorans]|uniref:Uncharacterized protein n=1 Tax=Reichenbachiella agarivorans TaxID=2979464 RepID=A0ABY6CQH0_9BACT|nr:hypothetical protein [Reichenbachiella agarivorans]UXP32769.1 hypothetical protein N6H18_02180 [Reichenbachiella agarivorans]